jgi:hypothetical protein
MALMTDLICYGMDWIRFSRVSGLIISLQASTEVCRYSRFLEKGFDIATLTLKIPTRFSMGDRSGVFGGH